MDTNIPGFPKFRVVTSGAETAVYLNGELLTEGHVVSALDFLDALDIPYEYDVVAPKWFLTPHKVLDKKGKKVCDIANQETI